MGLKVYNTLIKQKEEFKPVEPGKVKMYVCGITPYNHPHIGNARPFVTWDVFRRYLEFSGYEVIHVQNFTDVDDKIIRTAEHEGVSWDTISNRYIQAYFEVMDALHVRRAHHYPRVSDHIADILAMVEGLVKKGNAYVVDGDVYYSVESFPEYGKLSGRTLDEMQAGARVEIDERKHHPMDFALWKSAKPGEPAWDSPWGQGRPGWHIECSAMSVKYLGESFDFHGGGSDLVFPHHENEIAQTEAFTGLEPYVHYWLHNGFITINQEKMSKSLNNFFLVKDILEHYSADTIRFFLLSTHYRSPLDFSDERLEENERALDRLRSAVETIHYLEQLPDAAPSEASKELRLAATAARKEFAEAMDDDFNTALAVSVMFGLAKELNIYHSHLLSEGVEGSSAAAVKEAKEIFYQMADILGILSAERTQVAVVDAGLTEPLMELIIHLRQEARERKDWSAADAIRDQLGEIGILLEDSPQGVRWKRK